MNNYNNMFDQNDQLECSSGCESGWTIYLEHSSSTCSYNQEKNNYDIDGRRRIRSNNGAFSTRSKVQQTEDEDEDMSMVSDASSGPPHLLDDEEIYGTTTANRHDTFYHCPSSHDESLSRKKKQNNEKKRRKVPEQHSSNLLDDTASSPFFDFANKSNFTATTTRDLDQTYVENVLEYSQGYSSTTDQFEVRPSYQERFDLFQAPTHGKQLQYHNQWFEDKRW